MLVGLLENRTSEAIGSTSVGGSKSLITANTGIRDPSAGCARLENGLAD
ncbi:MAG: hypothetical protein ACFB2W_28090 [Leptolyngbyaceae cyanobacterium]